MAKPHIMYMAGGDEIQPEVESLSIVPDVEADEPGLTVIEFVVADEVDLKFIMIFLFFTEAKAPPIPFLVSVRSVAHETDFQQGSRDIFIGCVRTMAVSQKKVRMSSFSFNFMFMPHVSVMYRTCSS